MRASRSGLARERASRRHARPRRRSGAGRSPRATARGCRARRTGCPARAAISGPTLPVTSTRSALAPALVERARPAAPAASAPAPSKVTSTVWALRWRSSASVPSSTSRPSRRMPTRSQSASTSLRMCEERKTVWPRSLGLVDRVAERHLHQRVEAAGRLVEEQQVGAARERRDQLHLLAVALRQRAHLLGGVELEALDQRVAVGDVGAAAQRARNSSVSAPVSDGHRTARRRRRRRGGGPPTGIAPGVDAEELGAPAVGRCSPSSSRIVVVLPAPLGPR